MQQCLAIRMQGVLGNQRSKLLDISGASTQAAGMHRLSDAPVQTAVSDLFLHLKRAPGAVGRLRQRFLLLRPVLCVKEEQQCTLVSRVGRT
jgi:DNA phosphorothioation-dependent restriction protein DptG